MRVLLLVYREIEMTCQPPHCKYLFFILLLVPSYIFGQVTIKKAPIKDTSVASAEEMFGSYCAVCHGKDMKGAGPAASALKIPPPDLTALSRRHQGQFPEGYVMTVLRNGVQQAKAHGSPEMPIWADLFGQISLGSPHGGVDSAEVKLRIHNMVQYLESAQVQ